MTAASIMAMPTGSGGNGRQCLLAAGRYFCGVAVEPTLGDRSRPYTPADLPATKTIAPQYPDGSWPRRKMLASAAKPACTLLNGSHSSTDARSGLSAERGAALWAVSSVSLGAILKIAWPSVTQTNPPVSDLEPMMPINLPSPLLQHPLLVPIRH